MTVATTMNVRVVAYMKPAAQAWVHPIARAYSAAGTPRTTSIATRNTRHENDRPGTGGQCGYVQAGAGAHDEHRDQEPEADRFELDLELLLGSRRLAGPAHDDPGEERSQDGGQPEAFGYHPEG